jgi:hypothetical protein
VFGSQDRTRWDQEIDFKSYGSSELGDLLSPWSIDFLTLDNSEFDVEWTGPIDIKLSESMRIESSWRLLLAAPGQAPIELAPGLHEFPGPLTGAFNLAAFEIDGLESSRHFIRVTVLDGEQSQPLRTAPKTSNQVTGYLVDAIFILIGLFSVAAVLRFRSRLIVYLVLSLPFVTFSAGILGWLPVLGPPGNGVMFSSLLSSVALLLGISFRRRGLIILAVTTTLVAVSTRVVAISGGWGESILRLEGDDWTTYQVFAREMLRDRSLRAGEDVFYYQPGYRYFLAIFRILFGSGDLLIGYFVAFLMVAMVAILAEVTIRQPSQKATLITAGVGLSAVLVFSSSDYLIRHAMLGLSEPLAWLLILAALAILSRGITDSRSLKLRTVVIVAALSGTITAVRPNYLFAMFGLTIAMTNVFWQSLSANKKKAVWAIAGAFSLPIMLVLLHNAWFASSWTVVPTGASTVYDLTPRQVASIFSNSNVRTQLFDKLKGFIGIHMDPSTSRLPALPVTAMFGSWLAALIMCRSLRHLSQAMLALWPLLFLPPMVLFDIWIYYPRHIMAMPISLAAVVPLLTGHDNRVRHPLVQVPSEANPSSAR